MKIASSYPESPVLAGLEPGSVSPPQQAHVALRFLHLLGAVFACIIKTSNSPVKTSPAALFSSGVSSHAVKLIEMAAPRRGLEALSIHKQLHFLLQGWTKAHVYTRALRMKLRQASRVAYDAWLTWLNVNHPEHYQKMRTLSPGTHTHLLASKALLDGSWYNAPSSSIISHINGQKAIKTSALDLSSEPPLPLDLELETVITKHINDVAKIFAGPNIARFTSGDNVALNGLGQPISVDKRKSLGPLYYGVSEKCAVAFKKARKELPELVQVPDSISHAGNMSRNVPPPMDADTRGFPGAYLPPPSSTGTGRGGSFPPFSMARESGSSGNAWRGGGNSWSGDRGRGYGGGGGRGRGRGGRGAWN